MARAERVPIEEQMRMIQECRTSGLTDYQWCIAQGIKPGTFYNWVKRARNRACEVPESQIDRSSYQPSPEVVKIDLVSDNHDSCESVVEYNARTLANCSAGCIELSCQGISLKVTGDVNPALFEKALSFLGGALC